MNTLARLAIRKDVRSAGTPSNGTVHQARAEMEQRAAVPSGSGTGMGTDEETAVPRARTASKPARESDVVKTSFCMASAVPWLRAAARRPSQVRQGGSPGGHEARAAQRTKTRPPLAYWVKI
jgi:hypothetical protein